MIETIFFIIVSFPQTSIIPGANFFFFRLKKNKEGGLFLSRG